MTICHVGLLYEKKVVSLHSISTPTPCVVIIEASPRAVAESWSPLLFFYLNFNMMEIKFLRENGLNPFKNAIVAECLCSLGSIRIDGAWVALSVVDWPCFCKCVLHAAADCSRDQRGSWMANVRYPVRVTYESGMVYHFFFEVDPSINGLHYGSIS